MCIYKLSAVLETMETFLTCATVYCRASLNTYFLWENNVFGYLRPLVAKGKMDDSL